MISFDRTQTSVSNDVVRSQGERSTTYEGLGGGEVVAVEVKDLRSSRRRHDYQYFTGCPEEMDTWNRDGRFCEGRGEAENLYRKNKNHRDKDFRLSGAR